jgi:hypothetical protein
MHGLRLVTALLAGVAAARADVIVIDPGTGSGAPALAAALKAAFGGDVILLKAGDYDQAAPFEIHSGVTLLPAPDAGRIALRFVRVQDVWDGQTVVLRGLDIGSPDALDVYPSLRILNNGAATWLEDCTVHGGDGLPKTNPFGPGNGGTAVYVDLAEAVFRYCTLVGGRGVDADDPQGVFAGSGGWALTLGNLDEVALFDCTLVGGDSGNGTPSPFVPAKGATSLSINSGDATIAGCTLTGGAEGADNDAQPGQSGSALTNFFASSDGRIQQSTLTAGPVQGAGTLAPAISDPPHKVKLLAEPARSLVLPDQLREGESGVLQIDGEPGDLAMVLLSADVTLIPLAGQEGTLVTDLVTLQGPIVVGVLSGPDGQLALPFTLHDLPPGVDAITVYVQGLFKDAGGSSLGGASSLTWIDAAF